MSMEVNSKKIVLTRLVIEDSNSRFVYIFKNYMDKVVGIMCLQRRRHVVWLSLESISLKPLLKIAIIRNNPIDGI
jgi:hypothetical protein